MLTYPLYTPMRRSITGLYVRAKIPRRNCTNGEFQRGKNTILSYLRRASVVLPEVLSSLEASSWSKLISASIDSLTDVQAHKLRIAVWGSDDGSHSTELVSALLDDPLHSDKRSIEVLRNRRKELTDSVLTLRYGELATSTAKMTLTLPWLQKLDADIIEIPAAHPDRSNLLYGADFRIIVIWSFSTALPRGFTSLLLSSTSFLVFCNPILQHKTMDSALSSLIGHSQALTKATGAKLFRVYPLRALSAFDSFRGGSNTAAAIEIFQNDFLSSGVARLSESISQAVSTNPELLRLCHARLVLSGALEACRGAVEDTFRDINAVQIHIDKLHTRINEAYSRAINNILGGETAPEVTKALRTSTQDMRITMDALKWWKLFFKVDDLSYIISCAAERAWCQNLEAKLQFQTGQLSALRSTLTTETHATLDLLPHSFRSAVLVNAVHQISVRPPDLSPTTLTYPLVYRLRQLHPPILSLHRRAQRLVLATIVNTFVSAGGTYAAWLLGWIMPSTAVGLGVLGALAGMRFLAGSWEGGVRQWWKDWHRIGEGLERDLKGMLTAVLEEKVVAAPVTAADALSKAVAERLGKIGENNPKLESLEKGLCNLYAQEHAATR